MALVKHHVKKDVEILSDAGEWEVLEPDTPILKAADVEAWLEQLLTMHGPESVCTIYAAIYQQLDALRGGA